ncbi:MAG: glycosyltransferase family 39 protein [Sedimentisphaerales bacterium]|nr:glycosyltransferase family 39 protein [Sedimentisphaerales bacterium]
MSRKRPNKQKGVRPLFSNTTTAPIAAVPAEPAKKLTIAVIAVLLAWGIYHSVIYYGLAPFPHPDSWEFTQTGHELLNFQTPTSFKRAPVVCVLQAAISKLLPIDRPDIHAGWLLNAILHPLNAVLLFLVGRRLIGKAAAFLAVVFAVNPWTLLRLTEAIAETTMLFFILLTFHLLWRRSRWAYVAAACAILTRYDLAGLAPAVFFVLVIHCNNWRSRAYHLLWGFLCVLPAGLWFISSKILLGPEQTNYYHYRYLEQDKHFWHYFLLIWQTAFRPFIPTMPVWQRPSDLQGNWAGWAGQLHLVGIWLKLAVVSWFVTAFAWITGLIHGFVKKRAEIVSILIFLIVYLVAHFGRDSNKDRYYAPIFWIVTLITIMGFQTFYRLITSKLHLKPIVPTILCLIIFIAAIIASIAVYSSYPEELAQYSPKSVHLPLLGITALILILVAHRLFSQTKSLLPNLTIAAVAALLLISNQFTLATTVGNGWRDREFIDLIQWYRDNATPGQTMVTTLPQCMAIAAPDLKDNFIDINDIQADTEAEFALECLRRNITYVTWDSRLGAARGNSYYSMLKLDRILRLSNPQSTYIPNAPLSPTNPRPYAVAYYQIVGRVGSPQRHINIYHLYPIPQNQ